MMAKATNPISSKKVAPKDRKPYKYLESYMDLYRNHKDANQAFMEQLAIDVIKYAMKGDEESRIANEGCLYNIKDFCEDKKIPYSTYMHWVNKYDYLKEAHEQAMVLLGNRNKYALHKKLLPNEKLIMIELHNYCKDIEAGEVRQAKLKLAEDEHHGPKEIIYVVNGKRPDGQDSLS